MAAKSADPVAASPRIRPHPARVGVLGPRRRKQTGGRPGRRRPRRLQRTPETQDPANPHTDANTSSNPSSSTRGPDFRPASAASSALKQTSPSWRCNGANLTVWCCCVGGQSVGNDHSSNNIRETDNARSGSVRSLFHWLVLMAPNLVPVNHLRTLALELFKCGGHRIELRNRLHAGLEVRGQRKNIHALMHDSRLHGCDHPVDFGQAGVDLTRISVQDHLLAALPHGSSLPRYV